MAATCNYIPKINEQVRVKPEYGCGFGGSTGVVKDRMFSLGAPFKVALVHPKTGVPMLKQFSGRDLEPAPCNN